MTDTDNIQPAAAPPVAVRTQSVRKRGVRVWLFRAACFFLAMPVLAYLGILAWINSGFLNNSVAQRISKKVGSSARIGSIKTDALSHLRIDSIAVDAEESGDPLTIGSTRLDFNLFDLLANGKMRAVTIDRPNIELRHDPLKGWKPSLKLAPEPGGGLQVERVEVTDGTLGFAWTGGGRIKLTGVTGSYTETKRGAGTFAMKGALESGEALALEGQAGAENSFTGRAQGRINLERDASAFAGFDPGIKGLLQYDLKGRRDASSAFAAPRAPVSLDGTLNLKNFAWADPHSRDTAWAVEDGDATFKAEWLAPPPGGESTVLINEFNLSFALSTWPLPFAVPAFRVDGHVTGTVDFENNSVRQGTFVTALSEHRSDNAAPPAIATMFARIPEPRAAARIQAAFIRGDDGKWNVRQMDADGLTIPLASVGKMLGLLEKAGVRLGGALTGDAIHCDPATGTATGKLRLDHSSLRCAMSKAARRALQEICVGLGRSSEAVMIDTIGDVGAKDAGGEFSFRASREKLWLGGRIETVPLFVQALYVDVEELRTQPANVVIEFNASPDGACALRAALKSSEWRFTADIQAQPNGVWAGKMTLSAKELFDGEAHLELSFDPKNNLAGPIVLTVPRIEVSAAEAQSEFGWVSGLRLSTGPFSTDPARPFAATAKIAFDAGSYRDIALQNQDVEIKILPGGFSIQASPMAPIAKIESAAQFKIWADTYLAALKKSGAASK